MVLACEDHIYNIIPLTDGNTHWIAIAKDGVQVGNPNIDAKQLIGLINELDEFLTRMKEEGL